MRQIIGVKFKSEAKLQYFIDHNQSAKLNGLVVCRMPIGSEVGLVVRVKECVNLEFDEKLKTIMRAATKRDLIKHKENLLFLDNAKTVWKNRVKELKLDLKLISAACDLERRKIVFFFYSQKRVDFRKLVKLLIQQLRIKVELTQIGIRDCAKKIGGVGVCGRRFCCAEFPKDFCKHVSVKIVKEQNLALKPSKIFGVCGRLMCCLRFEQSSYSMINKVSPRVGETVLTPDGVGVVVGGNGLSGKFKVKLKNCSYSVPKVYDRSGIKLIDENEE